MPIEITTTVYKTFDGMTFLTFEEAKDHEDTNFSALLVGLTAEQIAAALDRKPEALHIADALEKAGNIIGRARREAGQFRRATKARAAGETEPAPEAEPQTEAGPEAEAA